MVIPSSVDAARASQFEGLHRNRDIEMCRVTRRIALTSRRPDWRTLRANHSRILTRGSFNACRRPTWLGGIRGKTEAHLARELREGKSISGRDIDTTAMPWKHTARDDRPGDSHDVAVSPLAAGEAVRRAAMSMLLTALAVIVVDRAGQLAQENEAASSAAL